MPLDDDLRDRDAGDAESTCCAIEAVISMDKRGQIVIPKDVREKAGITEQDKLAVVILEQGGEPCCVCLMKTEKLSSAAKEIINKTED